MFIDQDPQAQFSDLTFSEFIYDPNHPLLRLEKAVHWKNLIEALSQFYSVDLGRPTIPLRAQAGTLILKHLKKMSDRVVVGYVSESLYAQRFCGLLPGQVLNYMDPETGLTHFRKTLGEEGMRFIVEVIQSTLKRKPLVKKGKLIVDTTCVPADILYPTDVRLLERCRREVLRLMQKAKDFGLKLSYRTYSRVARKIFVTFSKISKPKPKTRKNVHKKMIQFVRRNLKQLQDLREKSTQELGPQATTSKRILRFLQRLKTSSQKIQIILNQQKQVYHGRLSIPGRIVSLHKDHVRPIMRGKFPLSTEFGPKILVAVYRGWTHVVKVFQNNVPDSSLVLATLLWFKRTFGHFPTELLGDRGLSSRRNEQTLNFVSVRSGLQPRGNKPLNPKQKKDIRDRLAIEARISLAKRMTGWGRLMSRTPSHDHSWITLDSLAANLRLAFFCNSP